MVLAAGRMARPAAADTAGLAAAMSAGPAGTAGSRAALDHAAAGTSSDPLPPTRHGRPRSANPSEPQEALQERGYRPRCHRVATGSCPFVLQVCQITGTEPCRAEREHGTAGVRMPSSSEPVFRPVVPRGHRRRKPSGRLGFRPRLPAKSATPVRIYRRVDRHARAGFAAKRARSCAIRSGRHVNSGRQTLPRFLTAQLDSADRQPGPESGPWRWVQVAP